jgi:ferredoxin
MTHIVTDNCRHCRYTDCVAHCPVACFHANDVRVYIDPDVCIDCGACIPVCPVHAIHDALDLAEDQQHWIEINARESKRHPIIRGKLTPLDGADDRRRQLGYS